MILAASSLFTGLVFLVLIRTSYVQTRIVNTLTQDFTDFTQQNISIQDIELGWNGKLKFKKFYLEDHHKDTLLYVKALETSLLDFKRLDENHFEIFNFNAKGLFLNLKKYKGEQTHSLKILLDKFKKDSTNRSEVLFKISSIDLKEATFIYKDEIKDEQPNIYLDSLSIIAKDLSYINNSLDVKIEEFEGEIHDNKSGLFEIKTLVNYKPGDIYLKNLYFKYGPNNLIGNLRLLGKNGSLRNFISLGSLDMKVLESNLDLKAIFPNNKNLESFPPLKTSFKTQGGFSALEFSNLKISNSIIDYYGGIESKNIFDPNSLRLDFLIDSMQIDTQQLDSIPIIPNKIKHQLNDLSVIKINGKSSISNETIELDIESYNSLGKFSFSGIIGNGIFDSKKSDKTFSLNINLIDLDLSGLISKNMDFKLGTRLSIKGDLSNKNKPIFSWETNNSNISYRQMNLHGIKMQGRIEENQLRNTLSINSEALKLKSDALYNYNLKTPKTTVLANIERLDLNSIGFNLGDQKKEFKGIISSNIKGKSIDSLVGIINISSASIKNEIHSEILNPLSITLKSENNKNHLRIENTDCISGELSGEFNISQLSSLFQSTFHKIYPFLPNIQAPKNHNIKFNLNIYKKLLNILYPNFSTINNVVLNGNINSNDSIAKFVIDAPLIKYKQIQLENLHFEFDTKNPSQNSYLSVTNFSNKFFNGNNLNLTSVKENDTLFFRSEFQGANFSKSLFNVDFYHTNNKNGASYFGIKKSTIPIGMKSWTINPKDLVNQKISFSQNFEEVFLNSLTAFSENQSLSVSGSYLNPSVFDLKLDLKNVLIENILPIIPTFKIAGKIDLKANIVRSTLKNKLDIESNIESLNINNHYLGDLNFTSTGNTKLNTYVANLNLLKDSSRNIELKGLWQGLEDPTLNFNLDFNDFDISFLTPLGKKSLNDIRGKVGGSVTLLGSLSNIKHNGNLNLVNGGFSVPFLNLKYDIEPTNVTLEDKSFIFKSTNLVDREEGTTALVNGNFSHTNFSNWLASLTINSNRMLLLNTIQKPESLFFGQGYLDGSVILYGPTKNLKISLKGDTERGTSIKIPWAESYGLSDTSFVSFINKKSKNDFKNKEKDQILSEIKGLELDFELDVNNKATVEIVIDKETGSYLSGRGAGSLLMEVNTKGKFNMWGDFITDDGIYNFKNLGVIDKKFNLKPGGSIVWEGNPLEAQMSLEAVYDVPGGANPALLLDNPNFNKNIPTEVLIRLQGNLLKPDDPIFEIDFPNTSGTVASEINYRLSDPQRSQLQAISLLSQGIFINEVSVSMQGITNNLYQKASDIVSNLISEENDKLKVGIDYLQGDKSALLDIATEDRLGFTLSTKISDKILLNGKIGVPVGGLEQTLIVGNVQIDFILNEEGSLRAKVFNKENEFRYIGDELGYTQGVGISYDVDFNTFKEMIQKIVSNKRESIEQIESRENKNSEIVKFIKKN